MCKFVANTESAEFFMIDGDVNGSWKTAPAQLFRVISNDTFLAIFLPIWQVFANLDLPK